MWLKDILLVIWRGTRNTVKIMYSTEDTPGNRTQSEGEKNQIFLNDQKRNLFGTRNKWKRPKPSKRDSHFTIKAPLSREGLESFFGTGQNTAKLLPKLSGKTHRMRQLLGKKRNGRKPKERRKFSMKYKQWWNKHHVWHILLEIDLI